MANITRQAMSPDEHGESRRVEQHRGAPADSPAALHRAERLAPVLGPDDLRHQHRAARPFGAEAEALDRLGEQQLPEDLRESGDERGEREPENR